MALPRFVANELKAYSAKIGEAILVDALWAGAENGMRVFEIFRRCKNPDGSSSWLHVTRCLIQSHWANLAFRQFKQSSPDNMDRRQGKLYVGLAQTPSGALLCEWRTVTVPLYFVKRLEQMNAEREARDRADAELVAKIIILRNKIYASRCFPSRLRLIIFDRDKHRCQICLRDKETLFRLGRHLQVDHIVPVIDGGKTTYSNGMTVCDECNIGKHHAKEYLKEVSKG